jgi:hypothetical protein
VLFFILFSFLFDQSFPLIYVTSLSVRCEEVVNMV